MKILGISCSPRKGQNTETMVRTALESVEEKGADAEFYSVIGKNIHPCDGCWSCTKRGSCHIDDAMQELYEKMKEADGIIFASPVYFFNITAQAKAVIDRTIALSLPEQQLKDKVAGIMVSAGSTGVMDTVKSIRAFFDIQRMFVVNWVGIYTKATDMPKGLEAARNLGREMVAFAKNSFKFPDAFAPNHFTFGTHTH